MWPPAVVIHNFQGLRAPGGTIQWAWDGAHESGGPWTGMSSVSSGLLDNPVGDSLSPSFAQDKNETQK